MDASCRHENAVMRFRGLTGFLLCACGHVSGPYEQGSEADVAVA